MSSDKCTICLQAVANQRNHERFLSPLFEYFQDDAIAIGKLSDFDSNLNAFCSHCQVFLVRLTELNAKLKTLVCKVKLSCDARATVIRAKQNVDQSTFETDETTRDLQWNENECDHQSEQGRSIVAVDPQSVKDNTFQNGSDSDAGGSNDAIDGIEQDFEADRCEPAVATAAADEAQNHEKCKPQSDDADPVFVLQSLNDFQAETLNICFAAGPSIQIYEDNWLPPNLVIRTSQLVKRLSERDFIYMDKYPFQGTEVGFKCGLCPEVARFYTNNTFTPCYNIIKHARRRHMGTDSSRTTSRVQQQCIEVAPNRFQYRKYFFVEVDGRYKCGECGILTLKAKPNNDRTSYIRRHIKDQHEHTSRTYVCKDCGKVFNNRESLRQHKVTKHGNPNGRFPCSDCGAIFGSSVAAISHRRTVHRKLYLKKFICKTCGKVFNRKDFLDDHVAFVHNGRKMNECKVCGEKFASSVGLKIHRHSHNEQTQYNCAFCSMAFTKSSSFTRHTKFCASKWHHENGADHSNVYEDNWLPKNLVIGPSELVKRLSERDFIYKEKYSFQGTESGFKCGLCPLVIKFCSYKTTAPWLNIIQHLQKWHIGNHSSCKTARSAQQRCIEVAPNHFQYGKYSFQKVDGMFKCGECGVLKRRPKYHKDNEATYMLKHINDRHDNASRTYVCEYCGGVYSARAGLKVHMLAKHGDSNANAAPVIHCEDNWLPKNCVLKSSQIVQRISERDFIYNGKYSFHGTEAGFKCGLCSLTVGFSTYRPSTPWRNLIKHFKKWHMGDHNARSTKSAQQRCIQVAPNRFRYGNFLIQQIDGMYECGECRALKKPARPYPHLNKSILLHIKHHHENPSRTYVCKLCGAAYIHKRSLSNHKIAKHEGTNHQIPCSDCGKVFANRVAARRHREKVHRKVNRKKFICETCKKDFDTKVALEHHVAFVHHGQRMIECQECGKKFASKTALSMHKNSHTGKNKYVCNICAMNFTQQYSVTRHKKTAHGT